VDIHEFLLIQIDTDVIFDNPADADRIQIANHWLQSCMTNCVV